MEYNFVFLILLLPALSFLVLGLLGMKMPHKVAGSIGTAVLGTIFCLSIYTAYEYFIGQGRGADGLYPHVTAFNFSWLKFSELLTFNLGFRLTPISVMMLVVITTVSLMVHIYSFGYMHGEKGHHVVEEADSRIDGALACAVKADAKRDFRFVCLSLDLGLAHVSPSSPCCADARHWRGRAAPPLPPDV